MTSPYVALTFYNVPIPRFLGSRKDALAWAEAEGHRWPGSRIVQRTAQGERTIWRAPVEQAERVAA